MLEALVEVWMEELINSGRIELENFIVIEVKTLDRGENRGELKSRGQTYLAPRIIRRLIVRPSKFLKAKLKI